MRFTRVFCEAHFLKLFSQAFYLIKDERKDQPMKFLKPFGNVEVLG